MKKILVIQLCRIGDILMTGPLLRGLRREHPSAELSLMVMDTFTATPLPSHLYDRLLAFPLGGLGTMLTTRDAGWEPALEQLRGFMRTLGPGPFDLVVNLTHTDMSALVTTLVPARKRVGFVARADRRKGIDSAWMTYLRAAVRSRDYTCFHLVDLFSWTAGVGRDAAGLEIDVTSADHAWAEAYLESRGLAGKRLIAMQLGASTESKQWPVERFAALADALHPSLGEILLVGSPGEVKLGEAFQASIHRRVVSSIGDSNLRQLAALLQRSRLLVTNDTGPMHVATAVGTRVLDISSGPIIAHETGPYGEGHVVIEPVMACYPCPLDSDCHHFACRTAVTPEEAAAVVRFALDEGPAPALAGARVLQSRRVGATGRVEFRPVGASPTVKDAVRAAAARVWEASLQAPARVGDGWADQPADRQAPERHTAHRQAPHGQAPDAHVPDAFDSQATGERGDIARQLEVVVKEAELAAARARALPKASPAQVNALANEVHASLERLLAIGESTRATHALVTHLRHEIDSIVAPDLQAMARAQAAAYSATAARARGLAERLKVVAA